MDIEVHLGLLWGGESLTEKFRAYMGMERRKKRGDRKTKRY